METVGWATATVAVLGGVVLVAGYILDQIPTLSAKAERAITALRRVRAAWRDSEEVRQREVPVPENDKPERPRSR
ncbi:hypothetical protein [Streptomyces sp. NPDC050982]|uniref:hypothetical protein n=1 Tax=Streptomyces sp. NPDC050982 TaxID=3154746 RepID=UPI0033F91978